MNYQLSKRIRSCDSIIKDTSLLLSIILLSTIIIIYVVSSRLYFSRLSSESGKAQSKGVDTLILCFSTAVLAPA